MKQKKVKLPPDYVKFIGIGINFGNRIVALSVKHKDFRGTKLLGHFEWANKKKTKVKFVEE